jgi:hypothetical protein
MAGYGIADILILSWNTAGGGGRALTLEKMRRERLTAFELKLTNWRTALMQAYRYRYFCDRAIVVLPRSAAKSAATHMDQFRRLGIGLWSFDPPLNVIRKYHTPRSARPKNPSARERAIMTILRRVQFRKAFKLVQARTQRR